MGRPEAENTPIQVDLSAVIVSCPQAQPRVLLQNNGTALNLPTGALNAKQDKTLEKALRNHIQAEHQLALGYVEQLYTFADQYRNDQGQQNRQRSIAIAYLALTHSLEKPQADWRSLYSFLPWEDWRNGCPKIMAVLQPDLEDWLNRIESSLKPELQLRTQLAFGLGETIWDPERVLERYELLYQAQLLPEYFLDHSSKPSSNLAALGTALKFDHRRMLAAALGRLRGKLKYRPVVFELLPHTFTLLQLQKLVESLNGYQLHKQNFRRLVEQGGLVEGTGAFDQSSRGRPAELFRFREAVLLERPRPGLSIR